MRLWRDDRGQGLVEYALIIALVAIVTIVALHKLGTRVESSFGCAAQALKHEITAHCGHGGRL